MKARPYRMGARAESAAATAERVLDATEALFLEDPARDLTLERIAERAAVSVQTVIRRFGGRDGVFAAAVDRASRRIDDQRATAPAGDLDAAVAVLVDHYEEHGDHALRMLADEARSERLAGIVARGRATHAAWCERVFAPALAGLRGPDRALRLAQLVAVCDVYTWKVLRRDRALSRAQAQRAIRTLLEPLVKEAP